MAQRHSLLIVFGLMLLGCSSAIAQAQDWPSRGRDRSHNPVVPDKDLRLKVEVDDRGHFSNLKWSADIGMGLYSEPAIADGLIWIGGSNATPRDPEFKGDAGVLFCFRESDGEFLYQYVSPRRKEGRNFDWPIYGIASTPYIEGGHLYFCTNRCETVCLNIQPLIDKTGLPKEVWKVDMVEEFGVLPGAAHIGSRHQHCSPVVWNDLLFVNTTHTVRPWLLEQLPKSKSPALSLICFDKKTGKVKWSDNTPGNSSIGQQWNNPTIIRAGGTDQVVMGQGDGWVRSFDCSNGNLIWKFDINEKSARLKFGSGWIDSKVLRMVLAEPVFKNERLFFAAGFETESCQITGRLCCVDPSKKGDISSELLSGATEITPNPDSGLIWEFKGSPSGERGYDADAKNPNTMHGTLGSVAIHEGFVVATDVNGSVHCLDEDSGKRHWSFDTMSRIYGSPLILGNQISVTNEDGVVYSIPLSKELDRENLQETWGSYIFSSSPVFANGTVYMTTYKNILAFECESESTRE